MCKTMHLIEKLINIFQHIKKTHAIVTLTLMYFLFTNNTLYAELIKQADYKPFVPEVMGRGNGYVAQAYGLHSLWYNPAGLAMRVLQHDNDKTEITPIRISIKSQPYPWEIAGIITGLVQAVENPSGSSDAIKTLSNSGMRLGTSLYGGITSPMVAWGENALFEGSHWGVALGATTDVHAYSYNSLFSTNIAIVEQIELMLGYAYVFKWYLPVLEKNDLEPINIRSGISVRPLYRSYNTAGGSAIIQGVMANKFDKILNSFSGLQGWGVGVDIGTQIEWEGITLGIAFSDIFTPLFYTQANPFDYYTFASQPTAVTDDFYMIPSSLDIGLAYKLKIDKVQQYLVPNFYAQLTDVFFNTNLDTLRNESFVKHMHMGINLEILPPYFDIQAGVNQGYLTSGIRADLHFLDLGFAVYAQEEGTIIRERPSPGMGFDIGLQW